EPPPSPPTCFVTHVVTSTVTGSDPTALDCPRSAREPIMYPLASPAASARPYTAPLPPPPARGPPPPRPPAPPAGRGGARPATPRASACAGEPSRRARSVSVFGLPVLRS